MGVSTLTTQNERNGHGDAITRPYDWLSRGAIDLLSPRRW